ncbi:MAG: carbon-nitrogen hydrolase family protein [Candidatus Thermoplasmatota archaeon]|nr:carbon-nitrogen hydrolase family protein [Candidatus Thermoplasmatota archaeon]
MTRTTVTLAQITCQLHDKSANLKRMSSFVRKTKGRVVIFPETSLTGYLPRDDLFKQAEPMDGPSIRAMASLAKETKKDIVFGAPIRDERIHGLIYNSSILATGHGKLFRYDKMYLPTFGPFEERVFFTPGNDAVVAQGMHARIGLMVCYDMFFPELAKLESLMGAQLLINISAAPTTSRPSFEKVMPARAAENSVFLAYTNLVGVHGSLVFGGGSVLYGPRGDEIIRAKELEEDIVTHEIDFEDLDAARRFRPLLRDSRPELFDRIGAILRGNTKK